MRLLLPLYCLPLFCLPIAGLSAALAHAEALPEVQVHLSQQLDQGCAGGLVEASLAAPGDCIHYRVEVENTGAATAYQVAVETHIPTHTRLQSPLAWVAGSQPQASTLEPQASGGSLLKTRLDELRPGADNRVVLEYAVQVL